MAENIFYEKVTDEILTKAAENVEVDSCNVERKEKLRQFLDPVVFIFTRGVYVVVIFLSQLILFSNWLIFFQLDTFFLTSLFFSN